MSLPDSLRILLSHSDESTYRTIKASLEKRKWEVLGGCTTAGSLVRRALDESPDLIITGIDLPDYDGVTALLEISQHKAIPAMVVTPRRSLETVERALRDHVMAYLIEPVSDAEIQSAVYLVLTRFAQFEDLRREVQDLRQALQDRKIIERAKGILMERDQLSEEDAYKQLRRTATDHRIKLVEAARQVLDLVSDDEP